MFDRDNGGVHWIPLDGAVNVRDVGGLPTHDGQVTARKTLLRADNLQGLSDADVSRLLHEHDLSTVVDLRSTHEVSSEGPGPLSRVSVVRHTYHSVLPEFGDATDAAADALMTRRQRALDRYPDDIVCSIYLGFLEDRPESVVGALRAVAETHGAALVHCAAGKDRTGVVVALALSAVGVLREAVVADYAASAERIRGILDRLRASPTYAPDIDRISEGDHTPRRDTMEAFLGQLDVRFGGPLAWLAEHGFEEQDVKLLRERLLTRRA